MVGFVIPLVVLAAAFQVISCQGPPPFPPNLPEECRRPPEVKERPHECCTIPPFFKEEDFEECGFKKHEGGPPGPRGPPDCSKQMCMMKKYGFSKDDETVDYDAVTAFLDKYSEENPDFKPAVDSAKEKCVGKELPGPPQICEANKIIFCLTSTLFSECPTWGESDGCKKLKAHLDLCTPFFKH